MKTEHPFAKYAGIALVTVSTVVTANSNPLEMSFLANGYQEVQKAQKANKTPIKSKQQEAKCGARGYIPLDREPLDINSKTEKAQQRENQKIICCEGSCGD